MKYTAIKVFIPDEAIITLPLTEDFDIFLAYRLPHFIKSIEFDLGKLPLMSLSFHRSKAGEWVNMVNTFTGEVSDDLEYELV